MSDSTPYAPPTGRLIPKRSDSGEESLPIPGADAPPDDPTLSVASARAVQGGAAFWDVFEPPEAIGPYQVQREIARGGMGIVFEAYHPQLDRQVALKILRADAGGDPDAERRFLREARAAARLRHPGIVAVHDVGVDDEGRSYLVMDLVPGESLKGRLEREGPLAPREAASLLERIARAVAHAHAQGILHRDLKPHNVLIDPGSGEPLLTDFGLAKQVRGVDDDSAARLRRGERGSQPVADLTQTDEILGTPRYMAPEQIDQRAPVGVHTDVYALGVVLYECLTGAPPFDGETYEDLFRAILDGRPRPPSAHAPDVPPQLEAVVLRCLEREPRLRYRSALALANDLERFQRAAPVQSVTHRARPAERGGSWARLGLPLAGVGLALVLLARRAPLSEAHPGPAASLSPPAAGVGSPTPLALATPEDEPGRGLDLGLGGRGLAPETLDAGNVRRYAEEGFLDAQHLLGYAILSQQVEGTPEEGLRWLEAASTAGYVRATLYLARVHLEGLHGRPVDPAEGLRWLRLGSDQGDLESALAAVLILIESGELTEAEARLEAADQGDTRVLDLLGVVAFKRGAVQRGVGFWERAAELGSTQAMRYLAQVLESGQRGVAADPAQAIAWLRRAAEAGDAIAMLELGMIHELGGGLPRDLELAKSWYRKALEAGNPQARVRLDALGGDDK